jgi:hypothetical protein
MSPAGHAEGLRGMGHRVSTPTQTGLGERKHLLSKDITLDTFVADIVNHIEAEELSECYPGRTQLWGYEHHGHSR